jgi:hypothetical protein
MSLGEKKPPRRPTQNIGKRNSGYIQALRPENKKLHCRRGNQEVVTYMKKHI